MTKKKRNDIRKKTKHNSVEKYKQMDLQLHYESSYTDKLFQDSPLAIVITDTRGNIIKTNHEFTRLFGFRTKDAIGKNIDKLISSQKLRKEARNLTNKTASGDQIILETERLRKNGTPVQVSIMTSPIFIKNKFKAIYSIYQNITERKLMEEALLTEKSYLEQLFESAQEAIVMTENDGRLIRVNKKFTRLFGYSKNEVIGQFLDELVVPLEFMKEATNATMNIARGNKMSFETIRRRKDGSILHVSVFGSPIIINKKQVAIYAIYRDITTQLEIEEALRENEEKYRTLTENINVGIYRSTLGPEGKYIEINPSIYKMFGYKSREEYLKIHPVEIYQFPEDRNKFSQKLLKKGFVKNEELRLKKKDGTPIICSTTAIVVKDKNKKEKYIDGIVDDITERKRIEEAFLQEKSYLDQLFESAQEAIVMTENNGIVMRVNQEFTKMFGYTKKESLGKFIDKLVAPPQLLKEASSITKAATNGKKMLLETVRRKKDGSLINVSVMGSPIIVNDKQLAVYAIYRDITERKQSEEQLLQAKEAALSASMAKSEFLANMSHEIRTPMNGIIGMTELTLDTDLNPLQREYLEAIKSSTDSLLTIINDILDFSRIEAKKIELESIHFNLRDFVSNVVTSMSMLAEKKGLESLYQISSDTPTQVKGDPGRIRQILVNLFGNAIKFTEKGEIVTLVKVTSTIGNKVYLQFSVSDTGIGIPNEKQKLIFQSFTQADGSTTRKYGGTGLGLAISSSLVDLMGGKIWVESQPNKGCTFYFSIGLEIAKKSPDLPKPVEMEELKGLSVLIVDDNATNRLILKDLLSNWKLKPEVASSGKLALKAMRRLNKIGKFFSLILVDVQMPEMDGFSLVKKIMHEFKHQTPTIMMLTSLGVRGDASRCQQLGISAYLVKPVKQSELLDAILLVCGKKKIKEKKQVVITRHTIREQCHTYNILLAEDNIINQKIVQRFLEKEGHRVSIAENGEEVLTILKTEKFDLILMDVQMPKMDGFEATSTIRRQELSTKKHIPILAMTAHAMKGDRERCLSVGMDEYIAKPIAFEKLKEIIIQVMKS